MRVRGWARRTLASALGNKIYRKTQEVMPVVMRNLTLLNQPSSLEKQTLLDECHDDTSTKTCRNTPNIIFNSVYLVMFVFKLQQAQKIRNFSQIHVLPPLKKGSFSCFFLVIRWFMWFHRGWGKGHFVVELIILRDLQGAVAPQWGPFGEVSFHFSARWNSQKKNKN